MTTTTKTPRPARIPTASPRYRRLVSFQIVREPTAPAHGDPVSTPAQAADVLRALIPDDGREHFMVLFLGSQNQLTGAHHVSTGSLSASIVHPREVLGPAIRDGAAHLILGHNHPSGDPTPSKEDTNLTRQLADGARVLGLRVHDHVIIGNGSGDFVSLAERGLI